MRAWPQSIRHILIIRRRHSSLRSHVGIDRGVTVLNCGLNVGAVLVHKEMTMKVAKFMIKTGLLRQFLDLTIPEKIREPTTGWKPSRASTEEGTIRFPYL